MVGETDAGGDSVAALLAARLAKAGCRFAFGVPGGEVLTLISALEDAGIRFVLARHETAAGFMAEAAWHRTGAPGVLIGTVGPGALNAVNAVANAYQDAVPIVLLTGAVDRAETQTYSHQVVDQRGVFAPITKWSATMEPGAAGVMADRAVAIAVEGRPGPVHLDLPVAVAEEPGVTAKAWQRPILPVAPAPDAVVDGLRDHLARAERPLIVSGLDAVNEGASAGLRTLAERLGAPVITTYKAKGVIPEDHPLALGGAGLSPLADCHLLPLVEAADVIVALGYDPVEMRSGWRDAFDPARQVVIDVAAVPNRHGMHQGSHNVISDCAATARALSKDLPERETWRCGMPEQARASLRAAFPEDEAWGPSAIISECRRRLPRETLATADSGAHRILLSQMWRTFEPRGLMQSSGFCTMGGAVPLAIGTKLASPERPVVSFSGDAGLLMVAGELATAADLGVAPIFIVFVDDSLALIEMKQRARQLPNAGVDFGHTDIAAIGRAFGGHGVTVGDRTGLASALDDALVADRFTVIGAEIARGAYDGRI